MIVDELRSELHDAADVSGIDVDAALEQVCASSSRRRRRRKSTRAVVVGFVVCVALGAVVYGVQPADDSRLGRVEAGSDADIPELPSTFEPAPETVNPISRVTITDDTHIQVGLPCPFGEPQVSANETATEVRLSARYSPTPFACLLALQVVLDAPLGQRVIVDSATDRPVTIEADHR
jgi:hypothetical protein